LLLPLLFGQQRRRHLTRSWCGSSPRNKGHHYDWALRTSSCVCRSCQGDPLAAAREPDLKFDLKGRLGRCGRCRLALQGNCDGGRLVLRASRQLAAAAGSRFEAAAVAAGSSLKATTRLVAAVALISAVAFWTRFAIVAPDMKDHAAASG